MTDLSRVLAEIRQGQVVSNGGGVVYRGAFVGGGFYLYKLIPRGGSHRGSHHYMQDTLVLVYADVGGEGIAPPSEITARER